MMAAGERPSAPPPAVRLGLFFPLAEPLSLPSLDVHAGNRCLVVGPPGR
jgi:hypothetical protein